MHKFQSICALAVKAVGQKVLHCIYKCRYSITGVWSLMFMFYDSSSAVLLKCPLKETQTEIQNSVISGYLALILTPDHSLTTCQVGGESSTNREQLNKLALHCQVLGGREEAERLKTRTKSPGCKAREAPEGTGRGGGG